MKWKRVGSDTERQASFPNTMASIFLTKPLLGCNNKAAHDHVVDSLKRVGMAFVSYSTFSTFMLGKRTANRLSYIHLRNI
jgi:hypothetical protein